MLTRTLLVAAIFACLLGVFGVASEADAEIFAAQTIDGPSADVLELGGVAMASDGSGGLVYRRLDGGRPHIFVSRLKEGRWQTPQRVDLGAKQRFGSSWPRIAAADGGRLIVIWVQEFGYGSDRMFGAGLDPGATMFQAPVPIDLNVGEATGTWPSLAMNRAGQALLTYRVLPDGGAGGGGLASGYIRGDIRIARFGGSYWSVFGSLVDRNSVSPVRAAVAGNAPQVGIDINGNGIVAFQEPDDEFVDRIWARRVFAQSLGIPLIVSPQSWLGKPLRGAADQFALNVAGFGQGAVAFRQQSGAGSALKGTRTMVATIPDAFSDMAGKFGQARIVDGGGDVGPSGTPGRPSVGVSPSGAFLTAFDLAGTTVLAAGDDEAVGPPLRVDDGTGTGASDPVITVAQENRASVAVWKVRGVSASGVAVREGGADEVDNTQLVSASHGGPVNDLALAGSGFGDSAIAFQQGGESFGQIAGAVVDAPPSIFAVQTPIDFVRSSTVAITWDRAPNALSAVTYAVSVDDNLVLKGLRGRRAVLNREQLPDGVSVIKVIAKDGLGQQTESLPAEIKVDRRAPSIAELAPKRSTLALKLTDGPARSVSGVDIYSTTISWGDGGHTARRSAISHRYAAPGVYRVTVQATDRAGNHKTIYRRVRIAGLSSSSPKARWGS
ncbi:MAG: PKD domain-containing protein [Solirubrobacterales bacterium]|nr:PKD domain-containing protein [Solirubrobacterales bacterium]